ncbi:MAG: XdhC family protein [Bacteroidota bacterium]
MKERIFWKFIFDRLSRGESVMLLIVVEYEKGSPGKTGFKMAVTPSEMAGTIGGGLMEFKLLSSTREFLASGKPVRIVKKMVHNPNTTIGEPSGLICAGSETICILSLSLDDATTIENIINGIHSYTPSHFELTNNGISFHKRKLENHNHFQSTSKDEWFYRENVGAEYTVYIAGGGHVGLATARMLQMLDFNLVLFDDREDAPAMKEDSLIVRKIISPYEEIGTHIEENITSFVAIVTAALQSDRLALQSILGKKLGYIGLMGTEAKIARIMNSFSSDEKKTLEKIYAPIGIEIESRSVEEIAVSIAAQMIKVKNEASSKH